MSESGLNQENTALTVFGAALRSAAASFPILATIGQAWSECVGKARSDRIERFVASLAWVLQSLEGRVGRLEGRFVSSAEVAELLERTLECVWHTASASKQLSFARVLAHAALADEAVTHDAKLALIDSLDSLTEQDLLVLSLFDGGGPMKIGELMRGFHAGPPGPENLGALVASLTKLEARGLIGETASGRTVDSHTTFGSADHWTNRWLRKFYEILPYGRSLVELMRKEDG